MDELSEIGLIEPWGGKETAHRPPMARVSLSRVHVEDHLDGRSAAIRGLALPATSWTALGKGDRGSGQT
jgi:hypothetical protein